MSFYRVFICHFRQKQTAIIPQTTAPLRDFRSTAKRNIMLNESYHTQARRGACTEDKRSANVCVAVRQSAVHTQTGLIDIQINRET